MSDVDHQEPVASSRQASETAAQLTGLTKHFKKVKAVTDLSLTIRRGEVVALLGPNGAGKSTTIDMLLGLTTPDSGTATLFGRPPRAAIAAGLVGAMLQSGGFLGAMSPREIVTVVSKQFPDPLPVAEALELAGIAGKAKVRFSGLSGGEKQRVRFAAALASNPQLLVLDEPTVAMDVEGRVEFWATMKSLAASGRTIIFATHYLAEAEDVAQRVVLLKEGRVAVDGSMAAIRRTVPGRVVTARIPQATADQLTTLASVVAVSAEGDRFQLRCNNSDETLRELLQLWPQAHDIGVAVASLEDAFLALTTRNGDR